MNSIDFLKEDDINKYLNKGILTIIEDTVGDGDSERIDTYPTVNDFFKEIYYNFNTLDKEKYTNCFKQLKHKMLLHQNAKIFTSSFNYIDNIPARARAMFSNISDIKKIYHKDFKNVGKEEAKLVKSERGNFSDLDCFESHNRDIYIGLFSSENKQENNETIMYKLGKDGRNYFYPKVIITSTSDNRYVKNIEYTEAQLIDFNENTLIKRLSQEESSTGQKIIGRVGENTTSKLYFCYFIGTSSEEIKNSINNDKGYLYNYIDDNYEYSGKYAKFYEICDIFYKAFKNEDLKIINEYFKEYFYSTILDRYRTKKLEDNKLNVYQLGEVFKAINKTYERLNGKAGTINKTSTIQCGSVPTGLKKEEPIIIKFNKAAKDDFVYFEVDENNMPLSAYSYGRGSTAVNTISENNEQSTIRMDNNPIAIKFIRPVFDKTERKSSAPIDSSYNEQYTILQQEFKVKDIKKIEDKFRIYIDRSEDVKVYNSGYLIADKLKQTLKDNIVSNILSSELTTAKNMPPEIKIASCNTKYEVDEFNSIFDDRSISVKHVFQAEKFEYNGKKVSTITTQTHKELAEKTNKELAELSSKPEGTFMKTPDWKEVSVFLDNNGDMLLYSNEFFAKNSPFGITQLIVNSETDFKDYLLDVDCVVEKELTVDTPIKLIIDNSVLIGDSYGNLENDNQNLTINLKKKYASFEGSGNSQTKSLYKLPNDNSDGIYFDLNKNNKIYCLKLRKSTDSIELLSKKKNVSVYIKSFVQNKFSDLVYLDEYYERAGKANKEWKKIFIDNLKEKVENYYNVLDEERKNILIDNLKEKVENYYNVLGEKPKW